MWQASWESLTVVPGSDWAVSWHSLLLEEGSLCEEEPEERCSGCLLAGDLSSWRWDTLLENWLHLAGGCLVRKDAITSKG